MKTPAKARVLQSCIRYDPPEPGTNMARELVASFKRHADRTLLTAVRATANDPKAEQQASRAWTGRQLLEACSRIATNLARQVGLKTGQTVMMVCDHSEMEILLALGAILAGCGLFGANPHDGYNEISTLCRIVKPDLICTNSRLHGMALDLRRNSACLERTPIVWIDEPCKAADQTNGGVHVINENNNLDDLGGHVHHLRDLIEGPLDEALVEWIANEQIVAHEHILTYMLTSGSTGRPKIVPSTHEELMHGMYSMKSACFNPIGSSEGLVPIDERLMAIDANTTLAGDLPLDHGAGLNTMLLSLSLGSKFVILPSYDEDSFWRGVHEQRITTSIASTTFAYKLFVRLKAMIANGEHTKLDLSCFKFMSCAGSKLAFGELVQEINHTYPHLNVSQCYGATEIGFIAMLPAHECRDHLDSVGYLFPGVSAKLVDRDTGESLGLGKHTNSELHVWAHSKFKRYCCLPEDDERAIVAACHDEENFYRTGDQVYMDLDARMYINGRFKDTLYLMEDWKILPAELENLVDRHPLVAFSAIIGVPDPNLAGCDAPRAFIKLIDSHSPEFNKLTDEELKECLLKDDRDFIADHIYRFVANRAAEPKHLRGGVRILDEFPLVGLLNKIDRKALRQIN